MGSAPKGVRTNAVVLTALIAGDYFGERAAHVTPARLSITSGLANLVRVSDSCGRTKSVKARSNSASEGSDGIESAVAATVANSVPGTLSTWASTIAAASAISADG